MRQVLRAEFVVSGESVTLGILRGLDTHMQAQMDRMAASKEPAPPGSPRLLRDSLVDYKGRWKDYRNAPKHLQVGWRRDPYNDQVISQNRWANGGEAGRML